jgi:cytochrome c oxidase assembly protein subunit 15
MRVPRFSAAVFRRITLLNVVLLVAIVVSGAVVRLTNSGLGCADWPNCSATKLVDVSTHHAAIEQLNRIFSGLIGVPIVIALVAAYLRVPRRRDLVNLGWLLLALFLSEAVLGGISVMLELAWFSVSSHFLLAVALIGVALTMHERAGEAAGPYRRVVTSGVVLLARLVYIVTIWVLLLGTLVTAAGPHGGDAEARRLGWPLGDVARVHGFSVDALLVLVLVLGVAVVRTTAPRRVLVAVSATLLVMAAQAVLGYVQYFEQIPAVLVGFHVFGATLVFVAVQQLQFELRVPVTATTPVLEVAPPASTARSDESRVPTGS